MKKLYIKALALACLFGSSSSCSFLDISDEVLGGMSDISQVFGNVDYTQRWYGDIYMYIPDYSAIWVSGSSMGNPWTACSDEIYTRLANNASRYIDWTSSNTTSSRWGLYQGIRQANIFLENARPIFDESGTDVASLTEDDIKLYKANARFLRAIFHYYLMEQFGPIPIVERSLSQNDNLKIPRNPLDEVIEFIDTELIEAMKDMHPEPYHSQMEMSMRAVPTKGAAMAFRAKLWVYAASPLFNGGFTEALSLRNPDGRALFPPKDDGTKLRKAVEVLKEFIEYAETGARYYLYEVLDDPDRSVYELFQTYNSEIIWANSATSWGSITSGAYDQYSTPRSEPNGLSAIHVLQELVDDFYMQDGLPIKETSFLPQSPNYSEEGYGIYEDVEVSNMYIGREARFYNTVLFSGKKWHISNREIQLYKDGNAGNNGSSDGVPLTGYYCYKRLNRTVHGSTNGVSSFYRPSIIFRLAEFYLLYSEMLNELEPKNPDVLKYVNLVRARAGLPNLEDLNLDIAGDQAMQREAIRRESRIELATEGQRYFDVRRWMIAENEPGEGGQGGDFYGMNVAGNKDAFHKRTWFQYRTFQRKNYLYPIPLNEVQKSGGQLIQNPGW